MAQERLSMRDVRAILRLHFDRRLSARDIARSAGCGRTTIQEYLARAKRAEIATFAEIEALSDAELETRLGFTKPGSFTAKAPLRKEAAMPDLAKMRMELARPSVTLALLWQEYREQSPEGYKYTQFCEHYRRFERKLSVTMRQEHKAGAACFVDYCDGLWLYEAAGERTQTDLFVGCLGASSFTYAEATLSQTLPEWLGSHANMYEAFGGVPEATVPDNLRSGVNKACWYEPTLNPSYRDLALHYGTCVLPARVREPRDKAKVEAAVLVAQRWILARLRDRKFTSLPEMNEEIAALLDPLNDRKMRHINKSRRELWEEIDKPALKPLPERRYEYAEWKVATVNIDYHVQFDDRFYSAPYGLARERVDLRATATVVEIYFRGKRVASHRRAARKGQATTAPEHMPAAHRARAEWSPSRVIAWAAKIGPNAKLLVEQILASKPHPEQGYRAALGIVRLEKLYGASRVDRACARAVELRALSYRFVNQMLKNKMDLAEEGGPPTKSSIDPVTKEEQLPLLGAENVRGSGYYH